MRGLPVNTTITPATPACSGGAGRIAYWSVPNNTKNNDLAGWPLLSVMLRYQRNRWFGPLLLIVAGIVGLGARPVYASDPSFAQAIPFHGGAYSVAVGDLNNDGLLDILVGSGQTLLYLNEGRGRFPDTGIPIGNSAVTESVAIGDLNGDGLLDPQSYISPNHLRQTPNAVNQPPRLTVTSPGATGNADFSPQPSC